MFVKGRQILIGKLTNSYFQQSKRCKPLLRTSHLEEMSRPNKQLFSQTCMYMYLQQGRAINNLKNSRNGTSVSKISNWPRFRFLPLKNENDSLNF